MVVPRNYWYVLATLPCDRRTTSIEREYPDRRAALVAWYASGSAPSSVVAGDVAHVVVGHAYNDGEVLGFADLVGDQA